MQPIDAYEDTSLRARRFLRLYEGMINTRQRRVRADWARSFCRLMHWPLASSLERVDSRDAVVVLRDCATLEPEDFSKQSLDDLLRAAIVYGVSALDRYVHERVVKGFVTAYRDTPLTKQQREFQMPVTLAMDVVDRVHASRAADTKIRPANEIRNAVQDTLHKRPFQSWREIEYAFCLLGYSDLSKAIRDAQGISVQDVDAIRNQLNKLATRRNHIVHEGDLARHQRGGTVRPREIAPGSVNDSLDFLDSFVARLEAI